METETITINMKKEVLAKLRKSSDKKKGFLGRTISQATAEFLEKKEQEDARKELLALLNRGFKMGKLKIKHREELYDRY